MRMMLCQMTAVKQNITDHRLPEFGKDYRPYDRQCVCTELQEYRIYNSGWMLH